MPALFSVLQSSKENQYIAPEGRGLKGSARSLPEHLELPAQDFSRVAPRCLSLPRSLPCSLIAWGFTVARNWSVSEANFPFKSCLNGAPINCLHSVCWLASYPLKGGAEEPLVQRHSLRGAQTFQGRSLLFCAWFDLYRCHELFGFLSVTS